MQIAALIHDVLEDVGSRYEDAIATFGARVLTVVRGCTDGMIDAEGRKPDWEARKRSHLAHLGGSSDDILLVSGCDKLHNARTILDDLQSIGPAVFERFRTGEQGTLWYFRESGALFARRRTPPAAALLETIRSIENYARVAHA